MFFVTTLSSPPGKGIRPRCVGFFHTLKEAKEILEKDLGDLSENGHYSLAVIEEYEPGLYSVSKRERYWYTYLSSQQKWNLCPQPECYRRVRNFAIC